MSLPLRNGLVEPHPSHDYARVEGVCNPASGAGGNVTSADVAGAFDPHHERADPRGLHAALYRHWQQASADLRNYCPFMADLKYGPDPAMQLDIHPADTPTAPVLIHFPGGLWQHYEKNDFSFLATAFTDVGICFVNVGMGTCPDATVDQLVDQATQAVLWIEHHISYFGGDPSRLFAVGEGSGGHLASLMLDTDWRLHGCGRNAIKGACAISGIFDLEPLCATHLNNILQLSADSARQVSPLHQLPERAPPLILSGGGRDSAALLQQQASFLRARKARHLPTRIVERPEDGPMDGIVGLGKPLTPLNRAVVTMVKSSSLKPESR